MKVGDIGICKGCCEEFSLVNTSHIFCNKDCKISWTRKERYKDFIEIEDLLGEEWRGVVELEDHYLVSNMGRIKSKDRFIMTTGMQFYKSKIIKPYENTGGYLRVSLSKRSTKAGCLVHRIVAAAFIPNPENKPEVNHKDFNRKNNFAINLEWTSSLENVRHMIAAGRKKSARGDKSGVSKLKEADIEPIFKLRYEGMRTSVIAKLYGVGKDAIDRILNRSFWGYVPVNEKYYDYPSYRRKLSDEDIVNVFKLKSEGVKSEDISIKYGLNRNTICNVLSRKTWKNVFVPEKYLNNIKLRKKK